MCYDFINSTTQMVEMLINIDTSVTVILRRSIKCQFKTNEIFSMFYPALLQTVHTLKGRGMCTCLGFPAFCVVCKALCALAFSTEQRNCAVTALPLLCLLLHAVLLPMGND